MRWIDVTLRLDDSTVHWPDHPRYRADNLLSLKAGDVMNVTAISMCSHFGTHVDAPRHYLADGMAVDQLPLDLLTGECLVVAYEGDRHIDGDFINSLKLDRTRRLLIRTRNSDIIRDSIFRPEYIGLTPCAAERVVSHGVDLLGVDGYSIGPFDAELNARVHQIFLGGGPCQIALEELDLSSVLPGAYELVALPLPLTGLEAAPSRVLLRSKSNS